MSKRLLLGVILTILLLFSTNCKKNTSNAIKIRIGPEPQTIDPTLNTSIDGGTYIVHIFEGLTTKDKDNNIVPGAAESWEISEDGLTYTFHIRENAKWSDGKDVVADDFVYSWQRAVDPLVASGYSYQLEPVLNAKEITEGKMDKSNLGIKSIDDKTLEVTLKAPTAYFLELTAFPTLFPIRKDIVEANPDGWTRDAKTYIGNGPFIMKERKIDEKLVLEKNTNYWNAETIVPQELEFILMDNPTVSIASIKDGSLDYGGAPPVQELETLKSEGYIQTNVSLGIYFYMINCTNEVLNDPRVRDALTLAIDRNYIVKNVTKGGQIPAGAFVPYGISDVNGDFRENGGNYYEVSEDKYQENVEKAKELLSEAGYPNGENFPVIEFKSNQGGGNLEIFEPIQQMWKNVLNIDVTFSAEEWAVFQQTRVDKNFAIAMHSWFADYNDPLTFLAMFLSYSDQNHSSYKSSEYDKLINIAMNSGDNNVRMKAFHDAERVLMNDMPIIPLYFHTTSALMRPNLKGVCFDKLGMNRFFYVYRE